MMASTYSTAAIDLMDNINRDVRSVLSDEAERIAYETGNLSVQPEHILEALQRVVRMLQSQQAETGHHLQSKFDSMISNKAKSRFVYHNLPTTEQEKLDREPTSV